MTESKVSEAHYTCSVFPHRVSRSRRGCSHHVQRTHPSDNLQSVRSDHDHPDMRRTSRIASGVQLWSSKPEPAEAEHLLWSDGADCPVHVQHHPLPEDRHVLHICQNQNRCFEEVPSRITGSLCWSDSRWCDLLSQALWWVMRGCWRVF